MSQTTLGPPSSAAFGDGVERHRRSGRRVPYRVPCCVKFEPDETSPIISCIGKTVNASADALGVQLSRLIRIGTRVEVHLPQLNGHPVRIHGEVTDNKRVLSGTFETTIKLDP